MNKTAKGKSHPKNKNHPWKKHNPNLFKRAHREAIDRYTFDGITESLKKKVGKDNRGAHLKPC